VTIHLFREIQRLTKSLLALGGEVESLLEKAGLALLERRKDLAAQVLEGDERVDSAEVEIEEECLKVLALHQPVASDLRFLIAVLKVDNDLERVGDLCSNLAERALSLDAPPPLEAEENLRELVGLVREMIRLALESLVRRDTGLARKVLEMDDRADLLNKEIIRRLRDKMRRDPSLLDQALDLVSSSKYLERIGDMATNIAEDVVFLVEGVLIRHEAARFREETSPPPGPAPREKPH